jgi:hypothetical protein
VEDGAGAMSGVLQHRLRRVMSRHLAELKNLLMALTPERSDLM